MRSAGFAVELPCKAVFCNARRDKIAYIEQARWIRERFGTGLWKARIDGSDESMPGPDALVDVGSGIRCPAPRLSETIATDASHRIGCAVVGRVAHNDRLVPLDYVDLDGQDCFEILPDWRLVSFEELDVRVAVEYARMSARVVNDAVDRWVADFVVCEIQCNAAGRVAHVFAELAP
jgi:hypothetical protein